MPTMPTVLFFASYHPHGLCERTFGPLDSVHAHAHTGSDYKKLVLKQQSGLLCMSAVVCVVDVMVTVRFIISDDMTFRQWHGTNFISIWMFILPSARMGTVKINMNHIMGSMNSNKRLLTKTLGCRWAHHGYAYMMTIISRLTNLSARLGYLLELATFLHFI